MHIDVRVQAREILTMDPARPKASRVGILNGRIVGFDGDLDGISAREVLDFGDACITPGLIDAHCHTAWWGLGLKSIDAGECPTLASLYDAIEAGAAALDHEPDAWIHVTGFNQALYDGAYPSLARLDQVTGAHPLYMRHTSGHAAVVNTETLQRIGAFRNDFEVPTGGVLRLDENNAPTGVLEEAAQGLVQALLMPYSQDALVDAIEAATSRYAAEGITSFSEAGVGGGWIGHSPIEVAAYQTAAERGVLHARAQLLPAIDALRPLQAHATDFHGRGEGRGLELGVRFGFGSDDVSFGHVKVFLDGSLLGATAAVTEDFCGHEHNRGYLLDDPVHYQERVLAIYRAGWPLALHAIGDAAIDLALDLIEEAQRLYGLLRAPCRIEHFGIARPDQVARAGHLRIAVTPQAGFIGPLGDQIVERVGEERADWLYRGRSIIDAGVILAGSSDLPVSDNNLRRGMQSAVDRLTDTGRLLGADEGITPEEALRTHTEWAAAATGQLHDKGTLQTGKLADMTVLASSPLVSPDIAAIAVVATILGGKISFDGREILSGGFAAHSETTPSRKAGAR
ncbi:amidohydrolase [Pseudoclavibacter terrae]|uniref:Amidohydrolase n=1 Tax=Pseudoclavibacter terrae TaxID=1530195 RepID=A0A7J5B5L3_9MICO|nr:amidohydrolase [Pseudoclavibacter terrae]KAB1639403.1 amidohydrolase [Pseudoclavibacter terrae]